MCAVDCTLNSDRGCTCSRKWRGPTCSARGVCGTALKCIDALLLPCGLYACDETRSVSSCCLQWCTHPSFCFSFRLFVHACLCRFYCLSPPQHVILADTINLLKAMQTKLQIEEAEICTLKQQAAAVGAIAAQHQVG